VEVDESVFAFLPIGNFGESRYDSPKRYESNSNVPAIYALKGGAKVAIGIWPDDEIVESVELGFFVSDTGSGNLLINVLSFDTFMPDVPLFLEDKYAGVFVDLRQSHEYNFTSGGGTFNDRFVIHFTDQSIATDIDENQMDTSKDSYINISKRENNAVVEVGIEMLNHNQSSAYVAIYSLTGELIKKVPINGEQTILSLPKIIGLYLVKAQVGNNVSSVKMLSDNK